jgi:hypothetical protein
MFLTTVVEKNQTTHVIFNSAFYEIMWKNIVESDRPQMKIRRMRFACWILKATNTHSSIHNTAFPQQKWLRISASVLACYIACLVNLFSTLAKPTVGPGRYLASVAGNSD